MAEPNPFDIVNSAWRGKPQEATYLRQFLGKQYEEKTREAAKKRLKNIPGTKEWIADPSRSPTTEEANKAFEEQAKKLADYNKAEAEKVLDPKPAPPRTKPSKRRRSSKKVEMKDSRPVDANLAASVKLTTAKKPIPTLWIARVLYVRQKADPQGRIYENKPAPYYEIYARRVKPAGHEGPPTPEDNASNPDVALDDICNIDENYEGPQKTAKHGDPQSNWAALTMYPIYTNADPWLRKPGPGDLITVSIEPGQPTRRGKYIGFGSSRPLPEEVVKFRAAQTTKAKLASNFPDKTPVYPDEDKLTIILLGSTHDKEYVVKKWKEAGLPDPEGNKKIKFLEHMYPQGEKWKGKGFGKRDWESDPDAAIQWNKWIAEGKIVSLMGFSQGGDNTFTYGVKKHGKGDSNIEFVGLIDPSIPLWARKLPYKDRFWIKNKAPNHVHMISRWKNWAWYGGDPGKIEDQEKREKATKLHNRSYYRQMRKVLQQMENSGYSDASKRSHGRILLDFFKKYKDEIKKIGKL